MECPSTTKLISNKKRKRNGRKGREKEKKGKKKMINQLAAGAARFLVLILGVSW